MSGSGEIDLGALSLEQLAQLRKQQEDQLRVLSQDYSALKVAQQKFLDSAAALTAFPTDGEGREMLVPLTSSLFVPGKLASTSEVLVDIGTGFFVGKPIKEAAEIMTRKANEVKANTDALQKVITNRQENLEAIGSMTAQKQAMMARMGGNAGAASA